MRAAGLTAGSSQVSSRRESRHGDDVDAGARDDLADPPEREVGVGERGSEAHRPAPASTAKRRPPDVCGSKRMVCSTASTSGDRNESRRRAARSSPGCGRDRRRCSRPRRTRPCRAGAGPSAALMRNATPLLSAISLACPSRPNPVMSVAAWTPPPARAVFGGGAVEGQHRRRSRPRRARPRAFSCFSAVATIPVPIGLVRKRTSPG